MRTTTRLILVLIITIAFFPLHSLKADNGEKEFTGSQAIQTHSLSLYFRHDEFALDSLYRNNAEQIQALKDILHTCTKIDSINIVSSASPEGVYEHNVKLSSLRAQNLEALILSILEKKSDCENFPTIHIYSKGEDWEGFQQFIEYYYYKPERNRILNILNAPIKNDTKKWRLKQINGGKTYSDIIYNYAYRFRTANSILVYGALLSPNEEISGTSDNELSESEIVDTEKITTIEELPRNDEEKRSSDENSGTSDNELSTGEGVAIPENEERHTVFAFKTNVLCDLVTFLNYAIEVPIGDRLSFQVQSFTPWLRTKDNQYCNETITLGGDLRYWLGNRENRDRLTGHHIGIYTYSGKSDLQWKTKLCYQTHFVSAGLSYGFALPVAKWLNLEFCIAAGWARLDYQHYTPEVDYSLLYKDYYESGAMNYFGPTKAEISLIIPLKAKVKGGVR